MVVIIVAETIEWKLAWILDIIIITNRYCMQLADISRSKVTPKLTKMINLHEK